MPRKNPGPPCAVCGRESVAKKLCATHYKRMSRHGHIEATRPADWGLREKHPLKDAWRWTGRIGRHKSWDDFWTFVSDVGERPTAKHNLERRNTASPFGPKNWYWSEPVSDNGVGDDRRAARAAYAKEWRAKNPLLAKSADLKKMYGIDLAEYERLLRLQNGGCAICEQKDTFFRLAVDHCHGTMNIRGLLCSQCNHGLGSFKDKPELLKRAAAYLVRSRK